MKIYNLFVSLILGFIVIFSALQYFIIESILWLWLVILTIGYRKNKNNFISMLLVLEILSLTSLFARALYVIINGVTTIMFVVITLSVGEAVLGLATLVKLFRWNSSEFLLRGLN